MEKVDDEQVEKALPVEGTEDTAISLLLEEKAAALKAAKAEKKFDKMFKTKKSSNSENKAPSGGKSHPEGSVEYWNEIREGLGIKKLKS